MPDRIISIPGPEHPIIIDRNPDRVVVSVAGRVVADTRNGLTLLEAAYPAVHYVPRRDVDIAMLQLSAETSYCPYKGDCTHYHIPAGGERSVNAVWVYEAPFRAVAEIAGHFAFHPRRVGSLETRPED